MFAVLGVIALQNVSPAIIPQPASVTPKPGEFQITGRTHIVIDENTRPVGEYLRSKLRPATGFRLDFSMRAGRGDIRLVIDSKLAKLGPEGYHLEVRPDRVEIRSSDNAGLFYGVQSLRQMLPIDIFRKAQVSGIKWQSPCALIDDKPRFNWRGMHLDVSRHFQPKEFILKFLDLMALHKFNVFHWHLVDDNGWRIEIKRYPRLTLASSDRDFSSMNPKGATRSATQKAGGYYTQDDIREIVNYAADRFITIVPEIELPGHSAGAINAYPELGNFWQIQSGGGSIAGLGDDNVYNVDDTTISFLKDVLAEVMQLFPSIYIHIGGDEVSKDSWKRNPRAQSKMRQLGLKNEDELQSWFIKQFDQFLTRSNRRLIGWDEILQGGIAPNAAVMSWRGVDGGIAAAKAGHDVVMTPNSNAYLDYYQGPATREPKAIGGFLPLQTVYAYEPIPPDLTPEQAKHILGAQANIWTEFIPFPKHVEYMAFPRECAMAEIAWSQKDDRDYGNFLARLAIHLQRLSALDVNYRPLDGANNDARNSSRPRNQRLSASNPRSERN